MIPRALRQLYSTPFDGNVEVSFFEIYNERIYDLLSATRPVQKRSLSRGDSSSSYDASNYSSRRSLDLREDKSGRFAVKDLRQVKVNGYEEAMYQLKQGLKSRARRVWFDPRPALWLNQRVRRLRKLHLAKPKKGGWWQRGFFGS